MAKTTLISIYQSALQNGLGPRVYVSTHFIERMLSRIPQYEIENVIKSIVSTIKKQLCVFVYECALMGGSIRIKIKNFHLVCSIDLERKLLILKTIY